ncbi:dual specificity protein phosphatase 3-like [Watersipora subatra]|uniref:dual specificity protein phosphatase 3-like n=1 Tax=Watersipora subatra TaxID=2589382 RepID=UPI00355C02FD
MAASVSKTNTLLPDQEATLQELHHILDEATSKELDKPNAKSFLNVHHGALVPMPDEYNLISEGLYIGGEALARDISSLEAKGIKHVVNCSQGRRFGQVNTGKDFYEGSGILYHGIPGHDSVKFDISVYFEPAASFIEEGLRSGSVYVHCHQGISRSATILIAFLMLKRGKTAVDALQQVLQYRPVRPNNGFLKRLAIFQTTLTAGVEGTTSN